MKKPAFLLLLSVSIGVGYGQDHRHLNHPFQPATYATLEHWLGKAAELREHILVANGLWPMPEKAPLNPQISEPINRTGYSIENVVLETQPGLYLTGNLYRPRGKKGPFPGVLSAHGHWRNGRLEDSVLASVPGRAINFALQGYVVFSYSMIGYNENKDLFPHRFDEPRHQLWGFSAMGLQLWNSLRALDFLSSLPDVDPERIAMTGASGGGTQTFLATAVDPRIKVAAPVNMVSAYMQGGCVCENAPLLRTHSTNVDIAALAAPRPLLLVSTSGDWTRHTPRVEFPAIQSVYRLFGAAERVANVHLYDEHNYNRESREAVYSWFGRWLLGTNVAATEQPFTVEDSTALQASLPAPPAPLPELYERFVEAARNQISAFRPKNWREIYAYRQSFGAALTHALEAEAEPSHLGFREVAPENGTNAAPAVLIAHSRRNEAAAHSLARGYAGKGWRAFLLEAASGDEPYAPQINYWTTYNPTRAATAVAAIRAAAEQIVARPDVSSLDLVGLSGAGALTLLARAGTPGVRRTFIDFRRASGEPFDAESDEVYWKELFIPLLRRSGDFRTAAVLVVPAELTIWNLPNGPLPSWCEEIYRAAGAADMLRLGSKTDFEVADFLP